MAESGSRHCRALTALVLLGLGANLGDRQAYLDRAIRELDQRGIRVERTSPLYETEPWGVLDQPRFLNAACACTTALAPHALLDCLHEVESALGRVRGVHWGPRTIDLDILLYDDLRLRTPRLVLPHPGLLRRASVLVPLADIAADVRHPVTGHTIRHHVAELGPTPNLAPWPPGLPPG